MTGHTPANLLFDTDQLAFVDHPDLASFSQLYSERELFAAGDAFEVQRTTVMRIVRGRSVGNPLASE